MADEYPEVTRSGWPPDDEYLEEAQSPIVDLADVVARLQKEMEEFRAPEGRRVPLGPQAGPGLRQRRYPCMRGKSSWDQYQQVFAAIVCSNGWDGVTATLQLVSHLERAALNVALLVPVY